MRIVIAIAGITLASCAFLLAPLVSDSAWLCLMMSPPFVTGTLVATTAICSRPRTRRALIGATDVVMMLTAAVWGALGLLFVAPGLIVLVLLAGWFAMAQRGDTEERAARTALATGALWTCVFAMIAMETGSDGVHLALVASVTMGFAGLAWLREIERTRRERTEPPRAVAR